MKNWILLDNLTKIQSQPVSTQELENVISRMPKSELGRYFIWTSGWKNWQPLKEYLESDQKTFSMALQKIDVPSDYSLYNTQTRTQNIISDKKEKQSAYDVFILDDNTSTNTSADDFKKESTESRPQELNELMSQQEKLKTSLHKEANISQSHKQLSTEGLNNLNLKDINTPYHNRSERHEFKIEILIINKHNKTFRSYSKNISLSGTLLEDYIPSDFYADNFDLVVVNRHPTNSLNSRVQVKAAVIKNENQSNRVTFVELTSIQKQRLKDLLNDYITQQKKKRTA